MIAGGDAPVQHRVGTAVMLAILGAVIFVVAIWPRLEPVGGVRVRVIFAHVGALREGAPLMVAGQTVGRVESIALLDAAAMPAGDAQLANGGASVLVRINDRQRRMIPANGEFFISSRGILSDRYLEVAPPRGGAAPSEPIAAGAQLRGTDPPSIDRALQQTWRSLVLQREFMVAIEPEVQALMTNIAALAITIETTVATASGRSLASHVRAMIDEASRLRTGLMEATQPVSLASVVGNSRQLMAHVQAVASKLRGAVDRLRGDLTRVQTKIADRQPEIDRLQTALETLSVIAGRVEQLTANGRELLALIERGEGSALKLANDPEFPEEAKEVGKILKRHPWRLLGRSDDATAVPRPAK